MIKAVIFDMDGVLIDSEPANLQRIYDFFAQYGKYADEEYLKALVGRSFMDTWPLTLAAWGETITPQDYQSRFGEYCEVHPLDYPSLMFEGVKELLAWLKAQGYVLAVASSTQMDVVQKVMKDCAIHDYFDAIISGADCKHSKPDPEIYLRTAAVLNLPSAQCVAIEDSAAGMESAHRAGMKVIAKIDDRYGADANAADAKVHELLEIKAILQEGSL